MSKDSPLLENFLTEIPIEVCQLIDAYAYPVILNKDILELVFYEAVDYYFMEKNADFLDDLVKELSEKPDLPLSLKNAITQPDPVTALEFLFENTPVINNGVVNIETFLVTENKEECEIKIRKRIEAKNGKYISIWDLARYRAAVQETYQAVLFNQVELPSWKRMRVFTEYIDIVVLAIKDNIPLLHLDFEFTIRDFDETFSVPRK